MSEKSTTKICPATGEPLPVDLAGFQQVFSPEDQSLPRQRVQVGDLLICADDGHREWAHGVVGCEITTNGCSAPNERWRVYRRIPVPKPGDHDINPSTGKTYAEERSASPDTRVPKWRKLEDHEEPRSGDVYLYREDEEKFDIYSTTTTREHAGAPTWFQCSDDFTAAGCWANLVHFRPINREPSASIAIPATPTPNITLEPARGPVSMPSTAKERKALPLATGVLDYFPDALLAVAACSKVGNDQHNPGKPLHWDRSKSTDEADALARHFLARGTVDTDGIRHSTKVAWRALALLQKEIEAARR